MDAFRVNVTFVDNAYWQVTIRVSPIIAEVVRTVVEAIQVRCECHNMSCQCLNAADCNCPCYSYEVIEESRELN